MRKSETKKTKKIRKTGAPRRLPDRLSTLGSLTRGQAVRRIARYLTLDNDQSAARELADLFSIDAEELTEAGVPFEMVRAFEERSVLSRCLRR